MSNQAQQADQPNSQDPDWAPTARAHTQYQRRPSEPKAPTTNSDGEEEEEEEEEEDEYEKRIERTGCSAENEALQMCYAEKHDWRKCQEAMTAFRDCWKRNGNVQAE
ncbi:hypothetical protein BGZ95_002393 [Linnemannia exigua]|uniref:CHCH domain-containing protein n=1 Tax=Linnemannia exigua TaxID=604196 RepID=A0AAD4H3E4_9FUNG|nr:hypothetical protein BGZ95_002393 [Linnemannia exigua]